jgi:hypothetical protein
MDTDFKMKIDVHFKEGSYKMTRTFRGSFGFGTGTTLAHAAAVMVQDLPSQPNFPANPTRLVLSIYPKPKPKKNPCASVPPCEKPNSKKRGAK